MYICLKLKEKLRRKTNLLWPCLLLLPHIAMVVEPNSTIRDYHFFPYYFPLIRGEFSHSWPSKQPRGLASMVQSKSYYKNCRCGNSISRECYILPCVTQKKKICRSRRSCLNEFSHKNQRSEFSPGSRQDPLSANETNLPPSINSSGLSLSLTCVCTCTHMHTHAYTHTHGRHA